MNEAARYTSGASAIVACVICLFLVTASGCGRSESNHGQHAPVTEAPETAAVRDSSATTPQKAEAERSSFKLRSPEDPVAVSFRTPDQDQRPGNAFEVSIVLDVQPPYEVTAQHVPPPAMAMRLELILPDGFRPVGDWTAPEPVRSDMPDGHPVHVGEVEFVRKIEPEDAVTEGKHTLACLVHYQACDATRCLRPVECSLRSVVTIR